MNEDVLNLMEFPNTSKEAMEEDACKIRPTIDEHTYTVREKNGNKDQYHPRYRMFVDDGGTVGPRLICNMLLLVASSIEACYLLLGYPGPIQSPYLPPTMSCNKMVDRAIGLEQVFLGILFNTKRLEKSIEKYKVERLLHIINTTWNPARKTFTVLDLDAARLVGNVLVCSVVCPWLRWSFQNLIQAIKKLLHSNMKRLARTRDFNELLRERDESWLDPPNGKTFTKIKLFNRSILCWVWHCGATTFISKAIRNEIVYIVHCCDEHLSGTKPWLKPISHIVQRIHDAFARGDASTSWGVGSYCAKLQYWFQIPLSDFGDEVVELVKSKAISINVLELVAIIVNYIAACLEFGRRKLKVQPRIHIDGDNSSANSWCYKVSNPNVRVHALKTILGLLSKSFGVGVDVEWLQGEINYFADALSRGLIADTMKTKFKDKCPSNIGALSCLQVPSSVKKITFKRYLPSPEIILVITCALLGKNISPELKITREKIGRFARRQNISFNFSNDWTWTLPSVPTPRKRKRS